MPNIWLHKLELGDVFHDEDVELIPGRRDEIVKRIRESTFWDPDDDDLVLTIEELEEVDSVEYFDRVWNYFYDWCDFNRVWVETH